MGRVLILIGLAEATTGAFLFVAPSVVSGLLLGYGLAGAGVMFAQLAGIALVGLGIACWPGPAALGLLIYGFLAGLYLAWLGFTEAALGPLLWPAVILHALMLVPLAHRVKLVRLANLQKTNAKSAMGSEF